MSYIKLFLYLIEHPYSDHRLTRSCTRFTNKYSELLLWSLGHTMTAWLGSRLYILYWLASYNISWYVTTDARARVHWSYM